MKRLLATGVGVLLVAVAVLILVTPVHANTSGTLVIASNTTLTEDHDGNIVIEADNVTLDCVGHTITGPGDNGIFFQFRTGVTVKNCRVTGFTPRWTRQIPPLTDTSKPAISDRRPRHREFYFEASSVRKSVWTLVRQLRGPHLSTWA